MLVKLFATTTPNELEYKINHFIRSHIIEVINIKYCTNYDRQLQQSLFSAMIIYKENINE